MEILDLRPRLERVLASQPARSAASNPLARLAGCVADGLAGRRASRRQPAPDHTLVVSIGNLRVGGTGKTPVTTALARTLADRGIAGTILTRGYGAAEAGPLVVAPDDPRGGDEARLMAAGLATLPWAVVQSRNRPEGLALAVAASPAPRVVILEDGYQTGRLGRHLDVLILDAWTVGDGAVVPVAGHVLPFGPYRETAAGARRAHVWLVESAEPAAAPTANRSVTGFLRLPHLRSVESAAGAPRDAAYGLLAGLARPEGFEAGCEGLLPRPPVLAVRCRDHATYDADLVGRILAAGSARGVGAWLTTGKDWVKLARHWPPAIPVQVVDLTVAWTGRETLPDLVEERLLALGAGGPRR